MSDKPKEPLLTLDEASEAIGLPKGRVVHLLHHELRRVRKGRWVYVPQGDVVAFVKAEPPQHPGGAIGPSPRYQWMIGEEQSIEIAEMYAGMFADAINGLSPDALRKVLQAVPELEHLLSETSGNDHQGHRPMQFQESFRIAIENSGLTLRELAERCDDLGAPVDYSYLSKIRSGTLPPPSDKVVRVLATALGLDPVDFALTAYIDRAPKDLRQWLRQGGRASHGA